MTEKIKFGCAAIIVLLLAKTVFAFGVASPYWVDNAFQVAPGETRSFNMVLQNMVSDTDVEVAAVLTGGSEIASTPERTYVVRAGTKNTEVPIEVRIPEGSQVGSIYSVTVSFSTVTSGSTSGAVALGTGIDTTFTVQVASEETQAIQASPPQSSTLFWVVTLIVVAIAVIAGIIIIRRRNLR